MLISDWSSDVCSSDLRIHLLAAWHEAPCYTDRERAALAWTEHLTEIATKRAPDAIYEAMDAQSRKEAQLKPNGRASCREIVCQYEENSVVDVALKHKEKALSAHST